jgi:hypothetical protein
MEYQSRRPQPWVAATLNYSSPLSGRAQWYTAGADGQEKDTGSIASNTIVWNARMQPPPGGLSLDSNGFELHRLESGLTASSGGEAIRAHYFPRVANLLQRLTGAKDVAIFDHTLRSSEVVGVSGGRRAPVLRVHNDQTPDSARSRLLAELPPREAQSWLNCRFSIVNVWQPLGEPVENYPLALCDKRTLSEDDVLAADIYFEGRKGEVQVFKPNPAHRWYYFPLMTPQEVLIFKIYDSAAGMAGMTAHTAFEDPGSPGGSRPRASIETRAFLRHE